MVKPTDANGKTIVTGVWPQKILNNEQIRRKTLKGKGHSKRPKSNFSIQLTKYERAQFLGTRPTQFP
ncbi:AFH_G0023380.mRNA.1.CDS.1 [Saccharomyces cerevisiae]|nr:AFH_G0023380.mRNA.1.CDS.1 [Saccharomyces cerevisiae]CAI6726799.1 AFH_G0023380.mRNA.1.CDS.1 [Saccharomyces cerevisiae]